MAALRYTPDEVAAWLAGSPRFLAALRAALDAPAEHQSPPPIIRMAVRKQADGKLSATLAEIAAGLEALGPLEDIPLLPRRVIRKKPAPPNERARRGRARPLPDTIILRRYGLAFIFWCQVLDVVDQRPAHQPAPVGGG